MTPVGQRRAAQRGADANRCLNCRVFLQEIRKLDNFLAGVNDVPIDVLQRMPGTPIFDETTAAIDLNKIALDSRLA